MLVHPPCTGKHPGIKSLPLRSSVASAGRPSNTAGLQRGQLVERQIEFRHRGESREVARQQPVDVPPAKVKSTADSGQMLAGNQRAMIDAFDSRQNSLAHLRGAAADAGTGVLRRDSGKRRSGGRRRGRDGELQADRLDGARREQQTRRNDERLSGGALHPAG